MNGQSTAPKTAAASSTSAPTPTRWMRNAEFLVYLVPVGAIAPDLYAKYVHILRTHSVLPVSSLTRPGGYAAELSPFKSFAWDGAGCMRFHFVSTADRIQNFDGEDVHACNRPIGVIGICHCPSTPSLKDAYDHFMQSTKHFPGMLIQKCFAFEHEFAVSTMEECTALTNLVMFPTHHELDEGCSTVSLHLQVVLDTISVTILMSLESTIRAALRNATAPGNAPMEFGEMGNVLLDTNVEPCGLHQLQHSHSSLFLSRDQPSTGQHSHGSNSGGNASNAAAIDARSRKRQIARQRKLFGDYSVLVSCVSDALEHYITAIELLKEEERRSNGAAGDALWLAAALEGYVFCLCVTSPDKFLVEVVEKTSDALTLYAKAGVKQLECLMIEHVCWYYVGVATQLRSVHVKGKGKERAEELTWIKRLLWDAIGRALMLFPDFPREQQVECLVQFSRLLDSVGHHRRAAMFLHDAASLLIDHNRNNGHLNVSPGVNSAASIQRKKELRAALLLEQFAAVRLGLSVDAREFHRQQWQVTTQRAGRRDSNGPWLILRLHVLRQMLAAGELLQDTSVVAIACLQLLQTLSWCDTIADGPVLNSSNPAMNALPSLGAPQKPFSSQLQWASTPDARSGLYAKTSIYYLPPASIETKAKRYFHIAGSPSATMSSAAASLTSTIANTPRMLATPRQQISAAVNAISTKASFSHNHAQHQMSNANSIASSPSARSSITASTSSVTSATSSPFVTGPDTPTSGTISRRGSETSIMLGRDSTLESSSGEPSTASGQSTAASFANILQVWNIRSKDEVVRMQRSLIRAMEAQCGALRPCEQVKLPTILAVQEVRALRQHRFPLMTYDAAMQRLAATKTTAKSDFFYSPFEKKAKTQTVHEDEGIYVQVYPAYELIELEVIVTNPLNVAVEIQTATVAAKLISAEDQNPAPSDPLDASVEDGVECYPCSFTMAPHESQKHVRLGIRPLGEGIIDVSGCFFKTWGLKTAFMMDTSLRLKAIARLPLVGLSLLEYGVKAGHIGATPQADPPTPTSDAVPMTEKSGLDEWKVCLLAGEEKYCELRWTNSGPTNVVLCRVGVSVMKAGVAKKSLVVYNSLQETTATTTTEPVAATLEWEGLQLNVRHAGLDDGANNMLARGEQRTMPFTVVLRRENPPIDATQIANDECEQEETIEWSFVYEDTESVAVVSPRPESTEQDAAPDRYLRETKMQMKFVLLPALFVASASLQPVSSETAPISIDADDQEDADVLMDNPHTLLVVDVANPTETSFRVRLGLAGITAKASTEDVPPSGCDVEIGRKCVRRLAIELPRVALAQISGTSLSLAALLNDAVLLRWETYFGCTGRLLLMDALWSNGRARQQLVREYGAPPVDMSMTCRTSSSPNQPLLSPVSPARSCSEDTRFPFRFVHVQTTHVPRPPVSVAVFDTVICTVGVAVTAAMNGVLVLELLVGLQDQQSSVTSEMMMDYVLVSGALRRSFQVQQDNPSSLVVEHSVALTFLGCGVFKLRTKAVLIPEQLSVLGEDECNQQPPMQEVWSHQAQFIDVAWNE
ncbi:TPA: hypothetical protein N0F65_000274 [Lagenidium giganteum]|uniref:Uncharacterized protein n=1 Tax=Lagenidium giganteum TaxID=4803 RepID=A0AAV2Z8P6_9STRA|nr:TPA: hypothetical protein N0F65_000274 [Lagenidium giganteum]